MQGKFLAHLAEIWDEPDRATWKSRGEPRHYVYSKVMAWVAFDRAVKCIEECGFKGPLDDWRAFCKRIHEDVCAKGFDKELNSFVQSYGSKWLDASLLLDPATGFLPIEITRARYDRSGREKADAGPASSWRHDPEEIETGLAHGEGAFLRCSYWLADCYVMLGARTEASANYSSGCSQSATTLDCWRKNMTSTRSGRSAISPSFFAHRAGDDRAHLMSSPDKPAEQRAEGSARQRS